jgi:uncharacterized glyoxalase superfamily protein PhnB
MTKLNPYLSFNGTCEEAFNFYRSVFGGDFLFVGRFKDMPENTNYPVLESEVRQFCMDVMQQFPLKVLQDRGVMFPYRSKRIQ